jgi:hypothetical protein
MLESINKIAIDEGLAVKAFNEDTKEYLSYLTKDNTLGKKRRIGIENFNSYIVDYQDDTTFIFQLPFTGINCRLKEEDIIEHIQTGKIKDLTNYLEIIQAQLTKINSKYSILPLVTPGFSDNRYFRLKGIDTIGFFPLDVNNRISGIHGINEYITKESIELTFEILYHLVKNIAF